MASLKTNLVLVFAFMLSVNLAYSQDNKKIKIADQLRDSDFPIKGMTSKAKNCSMEMGPTGFIGDKKVTEVKTSPTGDKLIKLYLHSVDTTSYERPVLTFKRLNKKWFQKEITIIADSFGNPVIMKHNGFLSKDDCFFGVGGMGVFGKPQKMPKDVNDNGRGTMKESETKPEHSKKRNSRAIPY